MIFCVEDEQNICELEVYTLQSVGMEAQGCGSGRELFALLEKQVPELIVLDIMLPDEDGVSILRRLRADLEQLLLKQELTFCMVHTN